MSQWTHVAAVIRFDGISFLDEKTKPDLGKTCTYDSPHEERSECNVPRGSEGSLQYSLWINPDDSHLARYVATIWGDLRDYSSVDGIMEYMERITKDKLVRSGVVSIEVEYQTVKVFHYVEKKWVECVMLQQTTGEDNGEQV